MRGGEKVAGAGGGGGGVGGGPDGGSGDAGGLIVTVGLVWFSLSSGDAIKSWFPRPLTVTVTDQLHLHEHIIGTVRNDKLRLKQAKCFLHKEVQFRLCLGFGATCQFSSHATFSRHYTIQNSFVRRELATRVNLGGNF